MSVGKSGQDGLRLSERFCYHVKHNQTGIRLDHYLVAQLPSLSRSQLTNSIKKQLISVNGSPAKASRKLKDKDEISGCVLEETALDVTPQKIDFTILYEDDHLLVISKPPQLVVHPGSGNRDNTLVNGLVYHCNHIADVGDPIRPGIVHRLDKDTSGVMLIAKKNSVHRQLVEDFKARRVKKIYHALVQGEVKSPEGRIATFIGRHPVNRKKMAVRERNGKFAVSNWRLQETYQGKYSLVEVNIETGRTHQIRVHMASIGHPVVGDSLYGGAKTDPVFPRQMLHSSELSFYHPESKKKLTIKAPLWPDMENLISSLLSS